MSYELKACKACKACESTNVKYYTYDSELNKYETHNAQCLDCGYNSCGHKTKKAMLKAWNTRPIEDALRQRVEELEAELEAIKIADRKDTEMACHYYLKCQKLEAWQKEAVVQFKYCLLRSENFRPITKEWQNQQDRLAKIYNELIQQAEAK